MTSELEITLEIFKHFSAIFKNQASPDKRLARSFLEGVENIVIDPPGTGIATDDSVVAQPVSASASGRDGMRSISYPTNVRSFTALLPVAELKSARASVSKLKKGKTKKYGLLCIRKRIGFAFSGPRGRTTCAKDWTLSEYRPISVLNTDYKLIASVLARRLKKGLPKVLRMNQRGESQGGISSTAFVSIKTLSKTPLVRLMCQKSALIPIDERIALAQQLLPLISIRPTTL